MKRMLCLLLALAMAFALMTFTGCSKTESSAGQTTSASETVFSSSKELYTAIWESYEEDEKFSVAGGDYDHANMEAPDTFDIQAHTEDFQTIVLVPDNMLTELDNDVTTLQNMMNTNTFSSAVMKLKDASKAAELAEQYKTAVQGTVWMCGFPDTVVVLSAGDYLITAYGEDEAIQTFKDKCTASDIGATLLVEAPAEG